MFKRHPILKYVLIRLFNYIFTIWAAFTVALFPVPHGAHQPGRRLGQMRWSASTR